MNREEIISNVVDAYRKTGLGVCQCHYFSTDGLSACAVGALGKMEGWPIEGCVGVPGDYVLTYFQKPSNWVSAFIAGFDDCKRNPRLFPPGAGGEYGDGYATGWATFEAVSR